MPDKKQSDFIRSLAAMPLTPTELLTLLPKERSAPQDKYWYPAGNSTEIDLEDFVRIAHSLGFRKRGSHVFRFVQDSRQVIGMTTSQFFDIMLGLVGDDDPDLANILDAAKQVIDQYEYQIIGRLERLEDFFYKLIR